MATWTTTTALKARIGRLVTGAGSALSADWDTSVSEALDKAEEAMRGILIGERGFSAAQIALAAWPAGVGYALDIGAFFFLQDWWGSHVVADMNRDILLLLDRREELRAAALVDASGAAVLPGEDVTDVVSGGDMDDLTFVPADLADEDVYVEDV